MAVFMGKITVFRQTLLRSLATLSAWQGRRDAGGPSTCRAVVKCREVGYKRNGINLYQFGSIPQFDII